MGTFSINQKPGKKIQVGGADVNVVSNEILEKFSPHILGLGDITQKSRQIDAICACIDLGGFTNFCKQVDPYLVLPGFLSSFLQFLFNEIKNETINKKYGEGCTLYHDLPFFVKFTGSPRL